MPNPFTRPRRGLADYAYTPPERYARALRIIDELGLMRDPSEMVEQWDRAEEALYPYSLDDRQATALALAIEGLAHLGWVGVDSAYQLFTEAAFEAPRRFDRRREEDR